MLQFHSSRYSMLRRIGAGLAVAAGLLAATLARADYLWLQPEGDGARVHVGELRKPPEKLPALFDAKAVLPEGKGVTHEQATGHFSVPRAAGDMRFAATRTSADGVLTGKKYDDVCHTATLSFEVPR